MPLAQGCNDHKEYEPSVNKESWTPGSETACCKAGSACVLKMKIPVKKNGATHQGHQCSLCDEYYHNICMIPAASATNDCGCGPSSSSETATVTPTGKGKGPAPKEGSEGSHSNLVSGASQNTKGATRQLKMSLNVRVRATCSTINRIVDKETSLGKKIQALVKPAGGGRTLVYGTVESGNSSTSWGVRWDFAGPDDELPRHKRADLTVMEKGATETAGLDDTEEEMSSLPSEGDVINGVPGLDGLSFDQLRALKEVKLWYKDRGVLGENHPDAHIRWTIHADGEVVDVGNLPSAFDREQSRLSAEFDLGQDLLKTFFESTFPSVEVHGKTMDLFLSNPISKGHGLYKLLKQDYVSFSFEQKGDGVDPDGMVKMGWALLIAGSTELGNGVANLWRSGPGDGRKPLAGFNRYMPQKAFEAWRTAAPYLWAKEVDWNLDDDLKTWDIFNPVLASFNEKRRKLFRSGTPDHDVLVMMLDETMTAWLPHYTLTGGLPNTTHCNRKPKPHGTEIRDAAHGDFKVVLYAQVAMQPVNMQKLKYFGEKSCVPLNPPIGAATSEVLRTAENVMGDCRNLPAGTPKRWVVADAWFGSIVSAVELYHRLGITSSFVVKGGTKLFPKKQLLLLLKARHLHVAGNWVVMTATMSNVKVMAIAYAWSSKGVSLWISTVGHTGNPTMYLSHYQNEYNETEVKEIPRPDILTHAYGQLPIIDEVNRQRQEMLDICGSFPTKDPWFRLMTGLAGMSVVDLHSIFTHVKPEAMKNHRHPRQFADLMLKNMTKLYARHQRREGDGILTGLDPLVPTQKQTAEDGWTTQYKKKKGVYTRCVQQRPCQVCKAYYEKAVFTGSACPLCNMPICKADNTLVDEDRGRTCYLEHSQSQDDALRCRGTMYNGQWTFQAVPGRKPTLPKPA